VGVLFTLDRELGARVVTIPATGLRINSTEEHFPVLSQGPLVRGNVDRVMFKEVMEGYG
jgi:hypothetical protein